jgi:hypothetical protein
MAIKIANNNTSPRVTAITNHICKNWMMYMYTRPLPPCPLPPSAHLPPPTTKDLPRVQRQSTLLPIQTTHHAHPEQPELPSTSATDLPALPTKPTTEFSVSSDETGMTSGKQPEQSEKSFNILYKEDMEKSLMDNNQDQLDYHDTTNTSSLPELSDLQKQFHANTTEKT